MADTFDDALEALRRVDFYEKMAASEHELRADPAQWAEYVAERDAWLTPELSTP